MESVGSQELLVSVVIPVRNEARFLSGVLNDLAAQNFPPEKFEILLIDGESSDETIKQADSFVASFRHFSVLRNPHKLSAYARNIGARASRGKYILFIDGHCYIPSRNLLRDVVNLFDTTGADLLCRPQPQTLGPQTPFQRAVSLARASRLGHALDSTIYTSKERFVKAASSGAMYRKATFEKLGYFDESFDACEDVEFNTRADKAGMRAYISPKLTVEYAARASIPALFKQLYRYGLGRWQLFLKHPSTLGSGTLITAAFTACAIIYPILWLISDELAIAATIFVAVYLGVILIASIIIAAKASQLALILHLPIVFFVIHFALGSGFLVGVFRQRT